MKKIFGNKKIVFVLAFAVAFSFAAGVFAADGVKKITAYIRPDISIVLDGQKQNLKDDNGRKVSPIVYNDTTYLPLRAISNAFGKTVDWNEASRTVTITTPQNGGQSQDSMKDNIIYDKKYTTKYISLADMTKTEGHLTNNTGYNCKYVVIEATYYDRNGKELGTGTGFVTDLNNGSRTSFDVMASGDFSDAKTVVFTTKLCY